MQSILESQGIPTYIRNQFASSVMGEVPFIEVCPQLYVLNDGDLEKARQLLLMHEVGPSAAQAWNCPGCGQEIEAQFAECWNCASQ